MDYGCAVTTGDGDRFWGREACTGTSKGSFPLDGIAGPGIGWQLGATRSLLPTGTDSRTSTSRFVAVANVSGMDGTAIVLVLLSLQCQQLIWDWIQRCLRTGRSQWC